MFPSEKEREWADVAGEERRRTGFVEECQVTEHTADEEGDNADGVGEVDRPRDVGVAVILQLGGDRDEVGVGGICKDLVRELLKSQEVISNSIS